MYKFYMKCWTEVRQDNIHVTLIDETKDKAMERAKEISGCTNVKLETITEVDELRE